MVSLKPTQGFVNAKTGLPCIGESASLPELVAKLEDLLDRLEDILEGMQDTDVDSDSDDPHSDEESLTPSSKRGAFKSG